jgi:hypothetical protein
MKPMSDERQRYNIKDSHRNQTFAGVIRKDPDTYSWSWKGHIDFDDGENSEFTSARTFATKVEAEDYMLQFVRNRIDNRLRLTQPKRF